MKRNLRNTMQGKSRMKWGKLCKALLLTTVVLLAGCVWHTRQAMAAEEPARQSMAGAAALRGQQAVVGASVPTAGPVRSPAAEDSRGTWESLSAFERDCFAGRHIKTVRTDLTHDGTDELLILELTRDEAGDTRADVTVFRRSDSGEVYAIYERQIDSSHAGWGWLYLYEENGMSYLLEYDPVLYEGTSRYGYSVFSLTADGGRVSLTEDRLDFEWDGVSGGRALEDQIRALNEKAFGYMERAEVIAAIGDEYFSGIHVCEFVESFE